MWQFINARRLAAPVWMGSIEYICNYIGDVAFGWVHYPTLTYEGNGVMQSTPALQGGAFYYTYIHFLFRLQVDGLDAIVPTTSPRWRFGAEVTHLSGSCTVENSNTTTGWTVYQYPFTDGWVSQENRCSYNLYHWSSGSIGGALLATAKVEGPIPSNTASPPDVQAHEDRWLHLYFGVGEITTTCQWKLNRVYVKPDGGGSGDEVTILEIP